MNVILPQSGNHMVKCQRGGVSIKSRLLVDLAALVGSQEVVDHTHKWRGGTIQFLDSCQPDEGGVQSATQTVTQTRI